MNIEKLEKMPLAELTALSKKVEAQIPVTKARERDKARDEIMKLAAAKGYSIKELIGEPSKGKHPTAGRKVAPKWVDPQTKVQWTGRGRTPRNFDKARAQPIAA